MTSLCLDIGNTRIKYGIFKDNILSNVGNWEDELISIFFNNNKIDRCIISNVRKEIPESVSEINEYCNVINLKHNCNLPILLEYETPHTLGADRIACAVGAHYIYSSDNCIILDAGTCIKSDFVSKEGKFLGGNISPGLYMRARAMNEFTGRLPLVNIEYVEDLLGKNTQDALKNGVLKSTIWEINAFIKEVIELFGESKIIFTGGDAKHLVNHINFPIFAEPNLVLIGLNEILNNYG